MLSKHQFQLLLNLKNKAEKTNQRLISEELGFSLGTVNKLIQEAEENGWISSEYEVTEKGLKALEPYRVENAIIMAAGMSTRFAPLSYETPKGLLVVKGERLIEREIKQLREAGIQKITVVVGYMKEKMFYLADKFGVEIVVNEDYYRYNNCSSLMLVRKQLGNTYICSSDNYFVENPFEEYVYHGYYSTVFAEGETDEYCVTETKDGIIKEVTVGGENKWYMLGHVYFDRAFSEQFVSILENEFKHEAYKLQLWEDYYARHVDTLLLEARHYSDEVIKEFDSLDELRAFDEHYLMHTNSKILLNICNTLNVTPAEITNIKPLKDGLTNTSFCFDCKGEAYVYRHPGKGTQEYINRLSEAASMRIAAELEIDKTFVVMNEEEGWKISKFIKNARLLDYDDKEELEAMVGKVVGYLEQDHVAHTICHGDCYSPNFLVDEDGNMSLIDWEYSGMGDPTSDIGTFVACSDYTLEQAKEFIQIYLEYNPGVASERHFLGVIGLVSYYWFLWALFQESNGKPVGEFLYKWYRYTKQYCAEALRLYEEEK